MSSLELESNNYQKFSYRQLDHGKREFRLLRFENHEPKTSLEASLPRCTIEHFSLQSAPPYTALSYRWGNSAASRKIFVNGQIVEISDNLFDFLAQEYSVEQNSKTLWIDQLCIDQSSIDERNHQVALMGTIYSKAIEVLVWLGNGIDGTEDAINAASYTDKKFQHHPRNMSDVQALQKIVSNEYWSRLWIIQEFVLARSVIIVSGSKQLTGEGFRELARDVAQSYNSLALARIWPFMKARRRLTTNYMMKRMAGERGRKQSLFHDPELHYTWQDVMEIAMKAQCSDVRDRVYGMLSMVSSQVRIIVDYTASAGLIRERVVEKEFLECFDRVYSQDALEEVDDNDFEQFVRNLNAALEL